MWRTNCPYYKLIMNKFISFFLSLAFAGSSFAQMPGYSTSQSDGTTLGANETLTANGIALGNAVKLRGYVNYIMHRQDDGSNIFDDDLANDLTYTSGDLDFLFDFSPVTAEIHLGAEYGFEQIFGRYSATNDLHITFGRQVTTLGFETDEWTNRYAVTSAYVGDAAVDGSIYHQKNYVDGIRLNYNNGMFGFVFGLLDHYGINNDGDNLDDGMAIELAASVMFFPGLEARLGFANENDENSEDDSQQVNLWLAWNPSALTLAFEYDHFNMSDNANAWDLMLLANYQFSDFFGATLRYSHMDHEVNGSSDIGSNRITLALLFAITEHFDVNFEYSHTSNDDKDDNELYLQGIVHF